MSQLFTNKSKAEIKQVFAITIAWLIVGTCVSIYDYGVLSSPHIIIKDISFAEVIIPNLTAVLLASMTGGTITVKYFQKWIRAMPYGKALALIIFIYTITCALVSLVAGMTFSHVQDGIPIFSKEAFFEGIEFVTGYEFLRIYFLWLFILMLTNIALLVSDKYGPGVFKDFLLGRYFQPRREDRIFMFLDLRSSTTIAEKLGEEKYFEFLKNVFSDVTPSILFSKGEIYQYVGDEIIVSWKTEKGLEGSNCINCFFEIKKVLLNKSATYKNRYGIQPEFKAGLHYGHVMAGEIGVVKRDITFLGDVLNTAARIQGKCNEMGVDILLSQHLLKELNLSGNAFNPKEMGDILLRGKQEKVVLYTV
ncbi:MAG: adenylate/guanylate cyclase domain-containing protein [Bacteroidota bacterium]